MTGFGGKQIHALGKVALPVSFSTAENARTEYITFDVVDLHYSYNAIFGQGFLNRFNAAAHMGYLCMKIPALHGVITVHRSQKEARNIEKVIYKSFWNINSVDSTQDEGYQPPDMPKGKTDLADEEETKCVPLEEAVPDRKVTISATLSREEELELLNVLQKNQDIFAWSASNLRGVSKDIVHHSLDIDPRMRPKKQRQRKMSKERTLAAKAEVRRLLDANVIREIMYPEWLANVVLVPKKNGKMRMCIDFTDLNKACVKDSFPLPRIDAFVDKAAGCQRFSLLDCFSGYHQTWLKKEDEGKTSFTTPFGTYCYTRMPEGLKNAGATFSRMMKKVLCSQLQRNIIAYVDDVVVMSRYKEDHIKDLQETFANLRSIRLKLNPEKCVFGVSKGKMLGYIVSSEGIRANPDKTKAIMLMAEPSNKKEVQKLTGRITALNRIISRSTERSLPFFKVLRGGDKTEWGPEQSEAFRQLKSYIATNLVVTVPEPDIPLLLYVAASEHAVSAVLVHETSDHRGTVQRPIYYVSEALSGAKLNYTEIEMITYAVLSASRKLKHYFQSHEIKVPTSQPLGDILRNKEASGSIGKWAAELSQFDITYVPKTSITSQALADFMADWTPSNKEEKKVVDQPWILYTDGAWGQLGAGAAAVLIAPSGLKRKYAARLEFRATNNIAEYDGLILGLNKAKASGAKTLLIKTDSRVVAGQVEKEYLAHNPELARYLAAVRGLERRFKGFSLQYIPRADNSEVDELAKATANNVALPEGTFYQTLQAPATESLPKAFCSVLLTREEDWRQAIVDFLDGKTATEDEAATKRMEARARNYTIIDRNLYKKGVVLPLLKCIAQTEGRELLQEIHSGICGSHIGPRALSAKALRHGFYWPTHIKDAEEIVKTCKACQTFSPIQSRPSAPTQLISPSWPLQRWGMDLVGPMPTAQGETNSLS